MRRILFTLLLAAVASGCASKKNRMDDEASDILTGSVIDVFSQQTKDPDAYFENRRIVEEARRNRHLPIAERFQGVDKSDVFTE